MTQQQKQRGKARKQHEKGPILTTHYSSEKRCDKETPSEEYSVLRQQFKDSLDCLAVPELTYGAVGKRVEELLQSMYWAMHEWVLIENQRVFLSVWTPGTMPMKRRQTAQAIARLSEAKLIKLIPVAKPDIDYYFEIQVDTILEGAKLKRLLSN